MNAQQVSDILGVLAARFGTTVTHLWEVLIRQVYVEAIVNTSSGIVLTVAAVVCSRIAWRWHTVEVKRNRNGYERECTFADDNEGLAITMSICAILLVVLAVVSDAFAVGSLAQLANPEYGALKALGAALGGAK